MDGLVQEAGLDSRFQVPSSNMMRVLDVGCHLVDLHIARPTSQEVLTEGLGRIGFSDVLLDQEPSSIREDGSRVVRFAGRLARPIALVDTPSLTWGESHPVSLDLTDSDLRERTEPFRLVQNTRYELRLVARMKAQPNRVAFEECLAAMGFRIDRMIALKRDMRIRGRPNTSATLWYGFATWLHAHSYTVPDDPFYFEDVLAQTPGTEE
jgi:hypothetical protein